MIATIPPRHPDPSDPAPASAPNRPINLPQSFTSFIGRQRDIDQVAGLLQRDDVHLVTLTGPGGAGKTRLAVQVTGQLQADFDQIWFVSLASVTDPAVTSSTIAGELGVDPALTLPANRAVRDVLANRRCLLVLDNFEHVLRAADQVAALLVASPLLTILVTSRIPLHLSAEHVYPVPPLTVPDSDACIAIDEDLPEAVRLFVDRARRYATDFTLSATNASAVSRICRALNGIPLAIELAAARVELMSPAAISSHLDQQLTLLSGGPLDAPARHRTIRATIAWSYDLLEPSAQMLIQRLGIFVNGFTLEAVEAIADDDSPVLEGIATLVSSSLVSPVTWAIPHEPRYQMLDSVREFALEQAQQHPDFPLVRHAHARYFTTLAEDALPLYDGPDLGPAMARICAELGNARAAISWCLEDDAGDREQGVRLAGALSRIWHSSLTSHDLAWLDRVAQGRSLLDQALPHIDSLPVEAVTEVLSGAAHLSTVQGQPDTALDHARELRDRARAEGYAYGTYWGLYTEGRAEFSHGNSRQAVVLWEASAEHIPAMRNPDNHAALLWLSLSIANRFLGQSQESSVQLARGLELARMCGNPTMIEWATLLAGQEARAKGELQEALALLRESANVSLAIQSEGLSAVLVSIARIAIAINRGDWAVELLGAATFSPFPEDRQDHEEALTDLRQLAGAQAMAQLQHATPGMPPARLDDILGQMEAIVASPDPKTWNDLLTPREHEVILLLAEGHSNRVIAKRLFISDRTVENHVAHILAKLDLDSRTAAAAWAVRHELA